MSESQEPNYEQEIRFAVVLYGGVSLAIYINGIAQELLRMVRGTAKLPPSEKLKGTEQIYRELGQILGLDGASREEIKPDSPIRTRFVVDIISGTSAGGINGVALAKALALKCKDLSVLRNTWLEEAQLDRLLNDKKSEFRKYPVGSKTTSLLNSERMYGKILETLVAMNDPENRTEGAANFADKIDLFVTATDLVGLEMPIQLTGQTITERVHKRVFHFEYPSLRAESEKDRENQFDAKHDPMLAFAARCTSSFPAAFEPMRFDHMKTQIKAQLGLSIDKARGQFEDFFPAYRKLKKSDFWSRQFADGGYLDNRPFSYVSELIQYRSATCPTERKLLFVDPFPELREQPEVEREISFVENALLAAVSLPRYEVIRGDIQTINTYNRRLERLHALKKRIETDRDKLTEPKTEDLPESPQNFADLDLQKMVVGKKYGEFYPRYHHLRVYDTTDELARLVTRLGGYEPESDQYSFLRRILRAWREAHYDAYTVDGKRTENAFLDDFDIDYRLRRLNHMRVVIDKKFNENKKPSEEQASGKRVHLSGPEGESLRKIRHCVEIQLKRLRDKAELLGSPTHSHLLRDKESRSRIAKLEELLEPRFARVMNEPDYEKRARAAEDVYAELRSDVDAIMEGIRQHLRDVFEQNSKEMGPILPLKMEGRIPGAIKDVRKAYHYFHWEDFLSLPFLEGTGAREYAEVEIYRVSPADSELTTLYEKEGKEKLVGTAVGAFGGFLQKGWREHDMMWGRLDGAERIITALLPESDHGDLRKDLIRRAQDTILKEEFSLDDPGSGDRVFFWLAHQLRAQNVSDRPAQELAMVGSELLKKFDMLSGLIKRKDFVTFLEKYYSPPPFPEPAKITDWSARSFKILGRMIDDLPDDKLAGIRARIGNAFRTSGVLLTNLLYFATPGSIGKRLLDHWLAFVALAGAVLLVSGVLFGGQNVAWIGYCVLLACLVVWLLLRAFSNWAKGRKPLRHPIKATLLVVILILLPLGAKELWELKPWEFVVPLYAWVSQLTLHQVVRTAVGVLVGVLAVLGLVKLWELRPWVGTAS